MQKDAGVLHTDVFDDMFNRFRSRSETTEICIQEKKEIVDIEHQIVHSPKQNIEVIEVCDSEDDCSNSNDDVVFLRKTSSESTKCGDDRSNGYAMQFAIRSFHMELILIFMI